MTLTTPHSIATIHQEKQSPATRNQCMQDSRVPNLQSPKARLLEPRRHRRRSPATHSLRCATRITPGVPALLSEETKLL